MEKPVNFSFCPRCAGAERLDWTSQDGGICYKCEGRGYQGEQDDTKDAFITKLRLQWADAKKNAARYKKLEHFLVTKLWSSKTRKVGAWGMTWGDLFYFCSEFDYQSSTNLTFKLNPDFLDLLADQYTWSLWEYKSFNKDIYTFNPSYEQCKSEFALLGANSPWKYALRHYETIGNDGTISYERTGRNEITVTFNNFK